MSSVSHERVTCGLSGRENDVARTREGHVRESPQEIRWQGHVRGHVGVSGTHWLFNYYFNKWV